MNYEGLSVEKYPTFDLLFCFLGRNMKKVFLVICLCLLFTVGCDAEKDNGKKDKNQIIIALGSEPEEGFDPCLGWGRDGNPLIQSTLISFDSEMNIVNDLATGYTISDDSLTWTFTLREDAKFSNGEMVTAKDVAFTFETAKNSGSAVDLTVLKEVQVVDESTVCFVLEQPQITFLNVVSQTGIVPEAYYNDNYGREPIGSGPFTLLQWNLGEQVILGVNPYYYGIQPSFERVTILFTSDETAYGAAIRGDVDVAITNMNFAQNEIEGMELLSFDTIDNRGLTLPTIENSGEVNEFQYPIGNNVTSDVAIRKALSYGINREKLVIDCLNGFGTPAYSECDGMPWSSEEAYVEYNKQLAKEILEEAGWILEEDGFRYKGGIKAEFNLLYNASDTARQALSVGVAEQAKELGIHIMVEGTSWDEIEKQMNSSAVMMGFGSQNPIETYYLYHSSNKGNDFYNPEYYENEITDQYIEEALEKSEYSEFLESYKKVQWDGQTGVSAQGEIPFVWLINIDHLYYVDENLEMGDQKIHPHGHSWPILSNLNEWTWKE